MDSPETATRRLLAAAVRGAEAITLLPAVPTPDWCERAARAMLPAERSAAAAVWLVGMNPDGTVARVDAVGVAGSVSTEMGTTVGRAQAGRSTVALDPEQSALAALGGEAGSARQIGWTPGPLLGGPDHAAPAERMTATRDGALWARWSRLAATGLGGLTPSLAAAWVGVPRSGRAVMVELGVAEAGGASADVSGAEARAVLDALVPALARRAALAFDPSLPIEVQQLTSREVVVLGLLLEGKSVRLIAEELGRSPHTVHDHVKSLHRKLNASTRGALVARALGHLRPGQGSASDRAERSSGGDGSARPATAGQGQQA
jgi:DNA-binding CsgD family transcriptional regulator